MVWRSARLRYGKVSDPGGGEEEEDDDGVDLHFSILARALLLERSVM